MPNSWPKLTQLGSVVLDAIRHPWTTTRKMRSAMVGWYERQRLEEAAQLEKVRERLDHYVDVETTRKLYDLNFYLVQEAVDRVHQLDSKAGVLVGFVGAILVLMLSSLETWKTEVSRVPATRWTLLAAAILIALSGIAFLFALWAVRFQWFDDVEIVFPKAYLDFPDLLARYYIIAMYRVVQSHNRVGGTKGKFITWGLRLLAAGGILMLIPLLTAIWEV